MHSLEQSLAVRDGHGDRPMVTDYGSKNIGRGFGQREGQSYFDISNNTGLWMVLSTEGQ